MRMTTVAITGASGGLGGRVARRLADRGIAQRLLVRDPARAPRLPGAEVAAAEYGDGDAVHAALAGVQTLLFVSASETEDRIARHLSAVDAAARAGLRRIVYVSFVGAAPDATFTLARHHWRTEEQIRSTGMSFTFLRDNLYQDVLPYFTGRDGVIRGPAGDGRVGFVARDDIADAAVAVLLDAAGDTAGHTFDLTGPQALSWHEVAEELSRASGRDVRYHAETMDEAYRSREHYGAPPWMVDGWVTSYAAAATGELDIVTNDIERLAGHPAQTFAQFLERNPGAVEHVRTLGQRRG
jgi:uncharacterized protein YbjT (DUF2867 family)